MKQTITIFFLAFLSSNSFSQNLEYRSVDYYFDIVEKLELDELKKEGILDDNLKIADKYKEAGKEALNKSGFDKYADIKVKILRSIFKDYLFQQCIEYKDDVYVLYFSMAGFDDTEWQILKWRKQDWDKSDKIDLRLVEDCKFKFESDKKTTECNFKPIAFNYDEGPKNLNNVKIFIKNDFLIMERGNLYHTLYDLKSEKLILNEESPWTKCQAKNKEEMNKWIKENLHNKIEKLINN
ncbi:hypothetical protein [Flavobacterium aquicola]|uniref:Uncharacterized protein n=1 Tax=Flavobacterium aquicola TaxID=1682742 RepID=A0A3E0ENP3_9FLAO|nr:hypothetical protein [Flavobacterium aquicola]REG99781.1 hypothetical protein C8P67_104418 [Flavobacterium aquicola]